MSTAVDRLRRHGWSPGYDQVLWEAVLDGGRQFTCTPVPVPGAHGECWRNARALVAEHPDRYAYVEGVAMSPVGRIGRGFTIQPNLRYPHAWVLDNHEGHGVEPTVGWANLVKSSIYVGVTIAWPRVEAILDTARARLGSVIDSDAGNVSVLELGRLVGA